MALSVHAVDKSTYVITCAFKDEDGSAVVPDSMKWSLTDKDGNVINSREDVVVSSPSASETVMLQGDDLKYSDGRIRIFTVEATYTSSLGSGLPLNDSVKFTIKDLKAVT